jgi:hypothetical protein
MANGSFQFSATSSDLQRALSAATQKARQQYGSGKVVTQDFVQDPQTGVYTGTIVYEPTPQEEKDATLDMVKRALVEDARANGTVTPALASTDTQAPAPDTVRNVRNNNPGNLRTGDVETAQRYYGEDAVTGVDEGGFAQFSSPEAGISALQQQVRVDTNRGLNLGEFLNKYTPESDDPSGNKAAKTNIPKLVNANLDTPLENINPTELALAITRQEGGDEALQAFGSGIRKPAPTLADIERGAANAETMAREREMSMAAAPKESPSGMRDFRKQRLIDANVGGLLRETATGMSDDQLLERMMMDQLEIGEKARDVPRDVSRDIQQGAIDEYGSLPITSFQEDTATSLLREARKRNAGGAGAPSDAVRVDSPNNLQIDEKETLPQLLARVSGTGEPIDFTTIAPNKQELPIESSETEPNVRDLVAGMDTTQRRSIDPRAQLSTERVEKGEISPVSEGVEVGLLSRIGKAITDNPELAASGAQLLGGLISNAAQNRAQRRADRTTNQRVARANLISAITGGRARPTVERAQADTGGFMSLDTLGKAIQGGGAAYKSELARQVAEDERKRKAGLDKRAAELAEAQAESLDAYRKGTLGQREKEFNAQQELLKKQAEQALAEQGEVNLTQLRANVKDVDDGLGLRKTGGYLDSSQGPKKLYNDMRVLFRQFEEDPNSANIMGIIQVYQRLFDPATVREGDVALMREAEGRIKQAVALAERVIGDGGVVSSYTIEDMKKAADDVHAMQLAKAKADVRAYTSRLFSANERKVLDEYYDDILSVRELPGEGEGSFISDLAGASLNLD